MESSTLKHQPQYLHFYQHYWPQIKISSNVSLSISISIYVRQISRHALLGSHFAKLTALSVTMEIFPNKRSSECAPGNSPPPPPPSSFVCRCLPLFLYLTRKWGAWMVVGFQGMARKTWIMNRNFSWALSASDFWLGA